MTRFVVRCRRAVVWLLTATVVAPAPAPAQRPPSGAKTPPAQVRRGASSAREPAPRGGPPNIVILVADDLGYADLGVQGMRDIPTPNIDNLVRSGIRFTDGYMTASLCSPSRAGILTGQYQERFGHDFNPGEAGTDERTFALPADMPTLPELLRSRGYATGIIGKWHLGTRADSRPTSRGFDEFFGFLGREHWYLKNRETDAFEPLLRGSTPITDTTYLTRAFSREAVAFMERHVAVPFLLYLPFNAVHVPMQEDPQTTARVSGLSNPRRRIYASMLASMDDAIGVVTDAIDRLGLSANTIVLFVSDNGGPADRTTSSNLPLRGKKGDLWEGGIRVPFAMRWPGHLKPGTTYGQSVSALDIAPTALAAAGGDPGRVAFDGVNLLPFLAGEMSGPPHARLFWREGYKYAVREGQWKLVRNAMLGHGMLFDLSSDISEQKNIASTHRDVVERLNNAYDAWARPMKPPRDQWPGVLGEFQQYWRSRKEK